jgi:dipeptidyl-peptidase-4
LVIMTRLCVVSLFLLTAVAPPAAAQIPERLEQRLAAIFERNEYAVEPFGPAVWLENGRRYVTRSADGTLTAYDTATGVAATLARAAELKPAGRIASFSFSSDESRILLFTNTRRVWRLNTRGDYWVFDTATRRLQQVGRGAAEASLMFAKFSPDGRRVAYVRQQNLYVEDLSSGSVTPLTTHTDPNLISGTSDWVNEEELRVRDAFKWSPDGRQIAYLQFDTSGVGRFTLINNTAALYPTLTEYPYPKAGTTNSAVRLGVVDASGGATIWADAPGDGRDHYIPRFDWIDATTLAFHHTARRQNADDFLLADSRTGATRRAYGETSKTWVDAADPRVLDPVRAAFWLERGAAFTWMSDRDGWLHIYVVSRDTGRERLVTRFDGDALTLVGVDEARGRIYFIASPENATQRYLYSADVASGSVSRVTPPHLPGSHSYEISPDGRWAFDTYSRYDTLPRTDLVSLPDHALVRPLADNAALARKVAPLLARPAESTQVTLASGVTLDARVVKPSTFDPARKYPAIVYVYGEPATSTTEDRWQGTSRLFHQALADEGYVILTFDNRGTTLPRGAAWRKVVYGSLGDLSAREQAEALRTFAATHSYIDAGRVGIYGHSGGGTATLHALFRFPDVYHVGVAGAPGPDQRLYDTIYQERYMGLPQENPDGYFRGSPINFAEGLRGRLLLIHGTGDDNVHLQNTERLVNRLVELGKDFDLMLYPNRSHGLFEGEGTTLHRWRTIARYFFEHLPPETRQPSTR